MTKEFLGERIVRLEDRVQEMEKHLPPDDEHASSAPRGWRAFVGVDADNPDFAEAVRLGREWRFADSPKQ